MRVEWDLRMNMNVSTKGQYLVCANHQTWNDIFVLMHAFGTRAPFFKFFIKQELIWVPVGRKWTARLPAKAGARGFVGGARAQATP